MKIINLFLGLILVSFFIVGCSFNTDKDNFENIDNDSDIVNTQVSEEDIDEVIDEEFIDEEEFLSDEYNEFGSMI